MRCDGLNPQALLTWDTEKVYDCVIWEYATYLSEIWGLCLENGIREWSLISTAFVVSEGSHDHEVNDFTAVEK